MWLKTTWEDSVIGSARKREKWWITQFGTSILRDLQRSNNQTTWWFKRCRTVDWSVYNEIWIGLHLGAQPLKRSDHQDTKSIKLALWKCFLRMKSGFMDKDLQWFYRVDGFYGCRIQQRTNQKWHQLVVVLFRLPATNAIQTLIIVVEKDGCSFFCWLIWMLWMFSSFVSKSIVDFQVYPFPQLLNVASQPSFDYECCLLPQTIELKWNFDTIFWAHRAK